MIARIHSVVQLQLSTAPIFSVVRLQCCLYPHAVLEWSQNHSVRRINNNKKNAKTKKETKKNSKPPAGPSREGFPLKVCPRHRRPGFQRAECPGEVAKQTSHSSTRLLTRIFINFNKLWQNLRSEPIHCFTVVVRQPVPELSTSKGEQRLLTLSCISAPTFLTVKLIGKRLSWSGNSILYKKTAVLRLCVPLAGSTCNHVCSQVSAQ